MSDSRKSKNGKPAKPSKPARPKKPTKKKGPMKDGNERNFSGVGKMKKKIDDDASGS